MRFSTPNALHKIISSNHKNVLVDGQKSCALQAMSVAFNFHTIDIKETTDCLEVKGIVPVKRNNKFLIR